MSCCICREALRGPPYSLPELAAGAIATRCGHLFHTYCIGEFWSIPETLNTCGLCAQVLPPQSNYEIFINAEQSIDELTKAMEKLQIQADVATNKFRDAQEVLEAQTLIIQNQDKEIQRLECQAAANSGTPGLVGGHFEDADALCMNCESRGHDTLNCVECPILRILDCTTNIRMTDCKDFVSVSHINQDVAKDVLRSFLKKINYRAELSRAGVQMVFSFHYFGHACWNCCSPNHGQQGCPFSSIYEGPRSELNRIRKRIYQNLKL